MDGTTKYINRGKTEKSRTKKWKNFNQCFTSTDLILNLLGIVPRAHGYQREIARHEKNEIVLAEKK